MSSLTRPRRPPEKRQTTEKAHGPSAAWSISEEHPAASHEDDDAALLIGVFGRTRFSDVKVPSEEEPELVAVVACVEQRCGPIRGGRRRRTVTKHNAIDATPST